MDRKISKIDTQLQVVNTKIYKHSLHRDKEALFIYCALVSYIVYANGQRMSVRNGSPISCKSTLKYKKVMTKETRHCSGKSGKVGEIPQGIKQDSNDQSQWNSRKEGSSELGMTRERIPLSRLMSTRAMVVPPWVPPKDPNSYTTRYSHSALPCRRYYSIRPQHRQKQSHWPLPLASEQGVSE